MESLQYSGIWFDGGDCDDLNAEYPDCNFEEVNPNQLGDRMCQDFGKYLTATCKFDGGNCTSLHHNADKTTPKLSLLLWLLHSCLFLVFGDIWCN